jgi:quercetin dioxygenase-like cupin family protein
MKVHELVERFAAATNSGDPMKTAREVLENLRGEMAEVERILDYISGVGGNARQVFYRSPDLTLLKVCFPNGRRTPPHDHGTWATILLLSGEEKNTLYLRENGTLRKTGEVALTRGAILPMRARPPLVCTFTAATSSSCRAGCGIRKRWKSTPWTGRSTRNSPRSPPKRQARRRHDTCELNRLKRWTSHRAADFRIRPGAVIRSSAISF